MTLALLSFSGCATTRYLLQLDGNPRRASAEACLRRCEAHGRHSDRFRRCLRSCPGAVVTPGRGCAESDVGPRAVCVEESRLSRGGRIALLLLYLPLALAASGATVGLASLR